MLQKIIVFYQTADAFLKNIHPAFSLEVVGIHLAISIVLDVIKKSHRRRKQKRIAERERQARETVLTMPNKEYAFLKDRLRLALSDRKEEQEYTVSDTGIRPELVSSWLERLEKAPLSVGERLTASKLYDEIKSLTQKEKLKAFEIRRLNECFSDTLKLVAKYSV